LPPVLANVILFGIKVFAELSNEDEIMHFRIRMGFKSNNFTVKREYYRLTQERKASEDVNRICSDAAAIQGMTDTVSNHQELGKRNELICL
jgi:hypothetical protein